MKLLDGVKAAQEIRQALADKIALLSHRPPRLDVILVGDDIPSQVYVNYKRKACHEVGMLSQLHHLPREECSEQQLLLLIEQLNGDDAVDAILVQLPLPEWISSSRVMAALHPDKDVDGFHPVNRGKLFLDDPSALVPCTPLGIMRLLNYYGIEVEGKRAVILGRSNLVGKPLAVLMMRNSRSGNATVTVVHRHSSNLLHLCREAELLVAAMGQPKMISADMVAPGAVVVDVGTTAVGTSRSGRRQLCGDIDFDRVAGRCSWITPVPGGVGPMTIAMLLENAWQCYQRRMMV